MGTGRLPAQGQDTCSKAYGTVLASSWSYRTEAPQSACKAPADVSWPGGPSRSQHSCTCSRAPCCA
eukprot:5508115-Lingulodinium_polyedra.AAC.1